MDGVMRRVEQIANIKKKNMGNRGLSIKHYGDSDFHFGGKNTKKSRSL